MAKHLRWDRPEEQDAARSRAVARSEPTIAPAPPVKHDYPTIEPPMSAHDEVVYLLNTAAEAGRRWTGVVVRSMLNGATRFGDIALAVPHLSDKMLAKRLKELETQGVITRTVTPDTPVRVEYALTPKGRALESVIEAMGKWADRWVGSCPVESQRRLPRASRARRSHRSTTRRPAAR